MSKEGQTTITENQVTVYKIRRGNKTGSWADITLDNGRISISSDYGSWAYYWGSPGSSFKAFLISLNIDYFAGKVGESNHFDHLATITNLRKRIDEYAFGEENLKTSLLLEYKELINAHDENEFIAFMHRSENILTMEGYHPDVVRTISPSFQRFFDGPWQEFIKHLKK